MQRQGLIVIRCINYLHTVSSNNNNTRRGGGGILTINAWNIETIEDESTERAWRLSYKDEGYSDLIFRQAP